MKQKILMMVLLTVVFSVALVSAANFSVSTTTPNSLSKSINHTSFLITPNLQTGQAVNMVVTIPQQISDGSNTITMNPPYTVAFNNVLNAQTQGPVVVAFNPANLPTNFNIGSFTASVNITSTDVTNSSNTISTIVPITFSSDFCTNGENGTDLSITRVDISNNDGDDTEWNPTDSISVKVEVSNDGSESIKSTYVELGFIDSSGKNVINNMDNLADKKIKIGTISDGKSVTKTFTFDVPVDINAEDYKLVVKAYSTDKGGQKAICTSHSSDMDNNFYQSISGSRETDENKQVIVNNVILSPDTAQCADNVQLSGDVVNVGDTDYEDRIKVTIFNKELGINDNVELNTDLSEGDSSSFTFDFNIPQNASEKSYNLDMRTYYDYDTNDGTYNLVSDRTFSKSITVQGNCQNTPVTPANVAPTITADLDSTTPEAIAGKEVLLKTTIRNNDVKDVTYTLSVSGNTAWSSLVSVDPQTVTVPAGQSKDVTVDLNVDSTATGDKQLIIQANYGNNQVKSQSVSVTITPASAALGSIGQHLSQNWFIYVIILVNVVLIIAIIVVIVKMMRPRRAA
jgi:hypothetical protein